MTEKEAARKAEPVVKQVVDLLAEKKYEEMETVACLKGIFPDDLKEMVEGYLELNELPYIDKFDAECNFKPQYEYEQLSCIMYSNGSGFHVDYDLTTDSELNDLTLQMEFLFDGKEGIKAGILDIHVM